MEYLRSRIWTESHCCKRSGRPQANARFSLVLGTALAVLLGALEYRICYAQAESDVTREKLSAIQKEIDVLRLQADQLDRQEDSTIKTLAEYDVKLQVTSHEIEILNVKQDMTVRDIQELQSKFESLHSGLEQQKQYLSHRLLQAYKLGEMNYLKLMLRVSKSADLLRSYQYIMYLARDDQKRVREYRTSLDELEDTRLRLEQENRNLSLYKQDLQLAQETLEGQRREKMKLLASIQREKDMYLSTLGELRVAALKLQDLFTEPKQSNSGSSPSGLPFAQYKGILEWPIQGPVIREFGKYRHPKFGTTTMSNGIEISAPEGTDVYSVFAGQVVFAEWFKGYGLSVILAHTNGYYTLYAHNSELMVRRGDTVQRRQVIARAGSTGSLYGSGLYFEIRKKDQPVNPRDWLSKLRARR